MAVAIVLGASTLGWNGVSLSEIAARAPADRISEATGGVQFVMFAGIVVVPPLFGVMVNLTESYAIAFLLLALLAIVGSFYLLRDAPQVGKLSVRSQASAVRNSERGGSP